MLLSSTSPKVSSLTHSDNQSTSVSGKNLCVLAPYYLYSHIFHHTSFHSLNIRHTNLFAVYQTSRAFLITLYELEMFTPIFWHSLFHLPCFIFSSLYLTPSDKLHTFKHFGMGSSNKI